MADAQESEDQESRLPDKPQAEYTRSMAIERTVKEIRGLTVEEILGKKLQDEQRVYIMVYNVGVEPDDETRLQSAEKIERPGQSHSGGSTAKPRTPAYSVAPIIGTGNRRCRA